MIRRLLHALMITALLLALSPSTLSQSRPPDQVIIYNQSPVDFRFVRKADNDYHFVGMLAMCDSTIAVRDITIYSLIDSVHLPAVRRGGEIIPIDDDCTLEVFDYSVHAGALRRQLKKEGECLIILHGRTHNLAFGVSVEGEALLLEFIRAQRSY
jgi:hypothetical protein